MSDFKEETKQNLKEGLRDRIESGTGIVGEALRAKREQKEKQKQIQEEVNVVHKTTAKIKMSGTTLTDMEKSFIQISENLQLIAKAFKAQTTTFEETQAAYQPQQAPQQRKQTTAVDKVTKNNEEDSLFDKVSSLIDGFETARKAYRSAKVVGRVAKGAAKGIVKGAARAIGKAGAKEIAKKASEAAIKASARKILVKSLGKLVGKSIPIAGAAVGIGFAVSKMLDGDWVGAGVEAVSGLGSAITAIPATIYGAAREVYFDVYGTWPESDPNSAERYNDLYSIVKSMAADMLRDNVKANESDAETARLKRQAVPVSAPAAAAGPAATPPPSTGAGAGRGGRGGPEAAAAIRATLTPKQLKWLGNADPTDPYIMARMPKAEAVAQPVVTAPSAPPPVPAPARPAPIPPAPAPAPPPTPAPPPAATSVAKPSAAAAAPSSSGPDEPLVKKISAQAGRQAMIDEMDRQGITDPVKRAAIMAQAATETGGFLYLSENLNYSADRMQQVFGRLKNTSKETIEQAIKQGVKGIGSLVYGGDPSSPSYQFGVTNLGNVKPGDGFRFRGRGFFQLTGRSNYAKAGALDEPEKLLELKPAAKTAVDFANRYKGDFANVQEFTKFVNGGQTHVKERGEFFNKFLNDSSITKANATLGKEIGTASTDVASAKKSNQGGSPITVIAINNNTQTKVGATNRPPQSQTTAVVGA